MPYGNLAYDYNTKINDEIELQELQRKRVRTKEKRESALKHIKAIFCTVLIAAAAFVMISRYVELEESQKAIAELEDALAVAEATTCQKTFELESMVDLNTVEEIATTRLGMQRPEKYQVVYVNINKADITEVTADEVEGIGNKLSGKYTAMVDNFIGIFRFN